MFVLCKLISHIRSVDVARIMQGLEQMHEVSAALLSLPLGFALLYSQVHIQAGPQVH